MCPAHRLLTSTKRRAEHNKLTPVRKTGVTDALQISSSMNSDSILGDCRTSELAVIEIGIESVLCEQLLVSALFNDRTVVHDKDVVRISDGRETVGNDEAGPTGHQLCHCFLDAYFRSGIDAACGFVENQNGWICQDHTRDGQQLLLTSRDVGGLFIEDGIVSFWQTPDEVIGMRSLGGSHDLLLRSVVAPVGNILTDRAVEEPGILQDHTKHGAQTAPAHLPGLDAVERDGAALDVIETHEQIDECGLACSGRPDDGDGIALLDVKIHVPDQGFSRPVAESDMIELDRAARLGDDDGVRGIWLLLGLVKNTKYTLGTRHRRLNDVGDARRLDDRHREGPRILDERRDVAQVEEVPGDIDTPKDRDEDIAKVADEVHQGEHDT